MADREKVMKGLECCAHGVARCSICPYDPRNNALPLDCMTDLAKDTLELLKAQEPCWISVKDKLPEAEVTVLAVKQLKDGRREICLARCIPEFTFYDYRTDREVTEPRWVCGGNNNILFWMPLPDMPKEG